MSLLDTSSLSMSSAGEETLLLRGAAALPIDLDLPSIKLDIRRSLVELEERGLVHGYKWMAEMLHAIRHVKLPCSPVSASPDVSEEETDTFLMSRGFFGLQEYDRCAHFTQGMESSRGRFLHYYSKFLSIEKKNLDNNTDQMEETSEERNAKLVDLKDDLLKLCNSTEGSKDGYLLYLLGVILKKLRLSEDAKKAFLQSLQFQPSHFGCWQELSGCLSDQSEIEPLNVPQHWLKHFFLAHTYLEMQLNTDALRVYLGLQRGGLQNSTYLMAQVAIAYHNVKKVDKAVECFAHLLSVDPCRLENLDTYSNLLYVRENRVELAQLAQSSVAIDKYRHETCCVIGNYYSLRADHEKAVLHFQRALKLNPEYLSAWTLMGHEYIELKNTNAAIQCYRRALEVSKRDYRAWYGLGQTYELLRMPLYSLYYYKKAQELRPDDSRMLVSLGEAYEKLDKIQEAMKCLWKAHCVGDSEGGLALFHLATLFEKRQKMEEAASAYYHFVNDPNALEVCGRDQQIRALVFLAKHFMRLDRLDEASDHAQRCLEFKEGVDEGNAILKVLANKRKAQRRESTSQQNHTASSDCDTSALTDMSM